MKNKKGEVVTFRASKGFKESLKAAAKRRKVSVGKFIRRTMMARMDGWFRPHGR